MAPTKKRQYQEEYLEHGFSFIVKNGVQCPQCVICHKVLANDSMKPFQLKMHLQRSHGELAGKGKSFFKLKAQGLKKLKLDGIMEVGHSDRHRKLRQRHHSGPRYMSPKTKSHIRSVKR